MKFKERKESNSGYEEKIWNKMERWSKLKVIWDFEHNQHNYHHNNGARVSTLNIYQLKTWEGDKEK